MVPRVVVTYSNTLVRCVELGLWTTSLECYRCGLPRIGVSPQLGVRVPCMVVATRVGVWTPTLLTPRVEGMESRAEPYLLNTHALVRCVELGLWSTTLECYHCGLPHIGVPPPVGVRVPCMVVATPVGVWTTTLRHVSSSWGYGVPHLGVTTLRGGYGFPHFDVSSRVGDVQCPASL